MKVKLKSIKKVSFEKTQCIKVSSPDGLYITNDNIITHNTTATMISNLYLATHFSLMRNPPKYFGGAQSSTYVLALAAWSDKKAMQIYGGPLMQVLETSPYFVKVRTRGDMKEVNDQMMVGQDTAYGNDCLPYTTAAGAGSICQFAGNLNMVPMSDVGGQMSLNICHASFSELTFFYEQPGWSEKKVWQFYKKTCDRVDSRMKGGYYGRVILDSSPNSIESNIDKYIVETAPLDPKNLIWRGARWRYFPEEFKNFIVDGKEVHDFKVAFPFYVGTNGEPPVVIESDNELVNYHSTDIVWCPKEQITDFGTVNYKAKAMSDSLEFLRDFAGIPAGSVARIFYDKRVLDNIFINDLPYIYAPILAKTNDNPEHLIWNQVYTKLFRFVLDKYQFRYKANCPRVAAVDLAKSGDAAGISVMHMEMTETIDGLFPCYITDFAISVVPLGGQINIDAFKCFIIDLIELGHLDIRYVGFDSFQSLSFEQGLNRYGVKTFYNSVDKTNEPYVQLIDAINTGRYFAGKSISIKNNLLSLQYTKRQSGTTKVDHFKGENVYEDQFCKPYQEFSEESFSQSKVGYFSKDISDTIASCINLCIRFQDVLQSSAIFIPKVEKKGLDASLDETLNALGLSL